MNKKLKRNLIVFILIIGSIFILMNISKPLALFGTSFGSDNVDVQLLSQSQYGYTYEYNFAPSDPFPYYNNNGNTFTFWIGTMGKPEQLPSDISLNTFYKTNEVTYTLLASISSQDSTPAQFTWKESYARCKLSEFAYASNGDTIPQGISCEFIGSVNENVNLYGLTNVKAIVYIPKIGFQCLKDFQCEEGFVCQSGLCQEVVITPTKNYLMYYIIGGGVLALGLLFVFKKKLKKHGRR